MLPAPVMVTTDAVDHSRGAMRESRAAQLEHHNRLSDAIKS